MLNPYPLVLPKGTNFSKVYVKLNVCSDEAGVSAGGSKLEG
jgi:hypothetical protein